MRKNYLINFCRVAWKFFQSAEQLLLLGWKKAHTQLLSLILFKDPRNKSFYYSTIASFYHIWSRERAKYETVIHCSVPV